MSNYSNTCSYCGHVGIRDSVCAGTTACHERKRAFWKTFHPDGELPTFPTEGCDCPTCRVERIAIEMRTGNETLLRIADRLDREARHWQEHPDYFTPRRDFYTNTTMKTAHARLRAYLADRVYFHRATHTDIVLRDLAAQLRRLAK